MAQREKDGGFVLIRQVEELMAELCVEVANPAGAQTALCGCQTDVLGCNADIYDAVCVLIGLTDPLLAMIDTTDDDHGSGAEPFAVVAFLHLAQGIG